VLGQEGGGGGGKRSGGGGTPRSLWAAQCLKELIRQLVCRERKAA
jgi:hypothetical protein